MINKGLVSSSSQSKHHQLSKPYVHQQGMRTLKLVDVLKLLELGLENKQYHHMKNFAPGKVFPQEVSQQIVDCKKNGDKIYNAMIKEQLQHDSTVGINAPVKKLQLNCFKKNLRKTPVKLKDRIVQLEGDANICRKIAIISKSTEIDCNRIISNHELTIKPWPLMNRTCSLYGDRISVSSINRC